jgi:glutamyl-tRNA(Gln) amidotransferase subunit E
MARQLHFYRLTNKLRESMDLPLLPPDRRSTDPKVEYEVAQKVAEALPLEMTDVSSQFEDCESKMVKTGLSKNSIMLALPLPGLAGLIGTKQLDDEGSQLPRLGRELAGAAKLAGVKGVFHSDELPAYGIEQEHVDLVRKQLSLQNQDGFVLCLAPSWQAELALESVLTRARMAWHRVSQEVRNVVVKKGAPEDGTTSPMRPLPGGARMYPETDIPTQRLTNEMWNEVVSNLPMTDIERSERISQYDISKDQLSQLLARELDDLFVDHCAELPHKGWATVLLENDDKDPQLCSRVLMAKENGDLTREAVNSVIIEYSSKPLPSLEEIAKFASDNDLKPADIGDLESIVNDIVGQRADFVKERGMGAMGPLMGIVMQAAGAADGKAVSALLRAAIQKITE